LAHKKSRKYSILVNQLQVIKQNLEVEKKKIRTFEKRINMLQKKRNISKKNICNQDKSIAAAQNHVKILKRKMKKRELIITILAKVIKLSNLLSDKEKK
jgi:hypothetical protein